MEQGLVCVLDDTEYDLASFGKRNADVGVDIVAVHGLGANRDYAWLRRRDPASRIEHDTNWLTDLLPTTLRSCTPAIRARVFCYNYDSRWLGRDLPTQRLTTLASGLLDALDRQRREATISHKQRDRPLILIGHSFGGLVIEKAIVRANVEGGQFQYLVGLVGGVLLLGTPHRGSSAQSLGNMIAKTAQVLHWGESGLMMYVAEESMEIEDLVHDFATIMIQKGLAEARAAMVFFENRKSNYGGRMGGLITWEEMIVPESSAKIFGIFPVGLDSDHFKLNKFGTLEESNYKAVSGNICRIAKGAQGLFEGRLNKKAIADSYFEIPNRRVRSFVGREDVLIEIDQAVIAQVEYGPRIVVLHGMGGQGKTQIALEYCHRKRVGGCTAIFWIDATSEATLKRSFEVIYGRLKTSQTALEDTDARVQFVLRTFTDWPTSWILVFDNFDDAAAFPNVQDYFPENIKGLLIITSRHSGVKDLLNGVEIRVIALGGLEPEAALSLLQQLARLTDSAADAKHSENIVERLSYHPLTITQAGAYIQKQKLHLDEFMGHYKRHKDSILKHTPLLSRYSRRLDDVERETVLSVFTTWELSFRQLETQTSKDSVESKLLTLFAFFDSKDIAEDLFWSYQNNEDTVRNSENRSSWLNLFREGGHWNGEDFRDVVSTLFSLSLVQSYTRGKDGVCHTSLHPLVKDWIQLRTPQPLRKEYSLLAMTLVERFLQDTWDNQQFNLSLTAKQYMLSHVTMQEENYKECIEPQIETDETVDTRLRLGVMQDWYRLFFHEIGEYSREDVLCGRIYALRNQSLGRHDPKTLESMNNLALVLRNQGKYNEAEEMHRQALQLRATVLGKQHSETLTSMDNLAAVLRDQGKYEEAEEMHRQVLQLKETLLEKHDPETLTSMNNLAAVLRDRSKYEEAAKMHLQALRLKETLLGKEHPSTLTSMNNLALVLSDQGEYEEAEEMHREALQLRERVLGNQHPETLTSMNNLAAVLRDRSQYDEAEKMYLQVLRLKETMLGKQHPSTLTSMNNLALVLSDQSQYGEAETMHRQVLQLRQTVLGKEHPSTLTSMNNLALVLSNQGEYEEAEEMHRQALQLQEAVLGPLHSDTLASVWCLAALIRERKQAVETISLFERACSGLVETLGSDHPTTKSCISQKDSFISSKLCS